MPNQPLSYQQQGSSCWITSVLNGMVFLLGSGEKIPNIIARMLYSMSSREGTDNDDAKALIDLISNYKEVPIKCETYEGEKVGQKLLRKLLKENKVIVCDTQSGSHSVLIIELKNKNYILVFDPAWERVCRKRLRWKSDYILSSYYTKSGFSPYHNVKISLDHFVSEGNAAFTMGSMKSRFALAMFKATK